MARNENPAVPEPLRDLAREFWGKGVRGARFLTDGDTLPPIPGAYVPVVDLARPLALSLPGEAPVTLGPGRYFYAGSAHGPGGIKARGSRHLRKRKALRWHIDHLTEAGTVAGILALPQGRECAALAALRSQPGTPVPVKGFGSSDRRACPAHLVMAAPGHGHPD